MALIIIKFSVLVSMKMIKAIDKFNEIHKELEQEERSLSDEIGNPAYLETPVIPVNKIKQSIKRLVDYLEIQKPETRVQVIKEIKRIFGKELTK